MKAKRLPMVRAWAAICQDGAIHNVFSFRKYAKELARSMDCLCGPHRVIELVERVK